MFFYILLITLAIVGALAPILIFSFYILQKTNKKKQEKFEDNYLNLLVKKNKELISSLKYLLNESLELAKHVEDDENFHNMIAQSKKVTESLDEAFTEVMKGTREESIVNLTILESQLGYMTDKIYNDIVAIEEKLGIERTVN